MIFRLVSVLAFVAHVVAIPAPQATPAPSAAHAVNGIPIPGIGTLLGVDTAISTGTTTVGGKACPTFTGGGTLYLINSTNVLGLGDATNHVDGHFDLTCKVLSNGAVVPDLKLYGGQDEHEHLTIPGVLTFSDGTGTISSVQGMDQGYVSVDILSGASGRLPVGDISVELFGQTFDFGDLNGFQINSDGLSGSVGGSASQKGGLGGAGSAQGILGAGTQLGHAGGAVIYSTTALASGELGASNIAGEVPGAGATGALGPITIKFPPRSMAKVPALPRRTASPDSLF